MLSLSAVIGQLTGAQVEPRLEGVDQRGFSDATLSADQTALVFQDGFQFVESSTIQGGAHHDGIAKRLVQHDQAAQDIQGILVIEIRLIAHDDCRNIVGFGHQQVAVNESLFDIGLNDGHDQDGLIHIGGEQVDLVFLAGALSDHIVGSWPDLPDHAGTIRFAAYDDLITNGHGVGQLQVAQSMFSGNAAGQGLC